MSDLELALGTVEICGVRVDVHTPESGTEAVLVAAERGEQTIVHLCNAHVLSVASSDTDYSAILNRGDLNLADGLPVALFSRRVGIDDAPRVSGPDLFESVVAESSARGISHFLYGGTPEALERLRDGMAAKNGDVDIRGLVSPPFRDPTDVELDALVDQVVASGAQILWVGLGTPRQDQVIDRLRGRLDVVMVSIGAAFDFLGGTKQRAPEFMQRAGLEWLHRLMSEPGRLGQRYVVGNVRFLRAANASHRLVDRNDEAIARAAQPQTRVRAKTLVSRRLVLADIAVIGLSSILAYVLRLSLDEQLGPLQNELPTAVGVLPLFLLVLYLFGCYQPAFQNQSSEAMRRFLGATTVGLLVLGFLDFLFKLDLARVYVLALWGLVVLLGALSRTLFRRRLRRIRSRGELTERVLIVGTNADALAVAEAMRSYYVAGYNVVGFVSDDAASASEHVEVLGETSELVALARQLQIDLVVISPTAIDAGDLQAYTIALEDTGVDIAVAPSLFEVVTRRVTMESVANVPILHVDRIQLSGWKSLAKRLEDVVLTLALAPLLLSISLMTAMAIKLDDGGPVFFSQPRVGRDGHVFRIYKFRTMVIDAEARLADLAELNEAGQHFFKIRDDPRVTRVGRFLRKWSIDEVPQFWNVVRGDMALVGPRPPIPSEVARYDPWHRRRLRTKPGITGVWQVSGRANVPFDEAVRLDLFYIENWSLAYDAYVLGKTVLAVLGRTGAY